MLIAKAAYTRRLLFCGVCSCVKFRIFRTVLSNLQHETDLFSQIFFAIAAVAKLLRKLDLKRANNNFHRIAQLCKQRERRQLLYYFYRYQQ
jgi:hypothetical protein